MNIYSWDTGKNRGNADEETVVTRPNNPRKVGFLPHTVYFKPAGVGVEGLEEVVLGNDEVEAIRLRDLLGMSQGDAAKEMNISQPTFHRLILQAHQKVADAFVNGKAVRIEGGNIHVKEGYSQPCRWRSRLGCKARTSCAMASDAPPAAGKRASAALVAVSSTDGTLDGMVDERFGRGNRIILYDRESGSVQTIDNTANMNLRQGAGIETAGNVAAKGARTVIAGHLGPNAFHVLTDAGIEAYSASNMTVREALEKFDQGALPRLREADVEGHWGTKVKQRGRGKGKRRGKL